MKNRFEKSKTRAPIVRLRFMAIGLALLALLFAVPMLLVWKQAFIASSSMRIEKMADTITVMDREIATLRFRCSRLSSNERIETYARTVLRLEYPAMDRIMLLQLPEKPEPKGFIAVLERLYASVKSYCTKGGRG